MDILTALSSNKGVRVSHIMQRANLSWLAMISCLEALEQHGLIEKLESQQRRKFWRITQNGSEVLRSFNETKVAVGLNEKIQENV